MAVLVAGRTFTSSSASKGAIGIELGGYRAGGALLGTKRVSAGKPPACWPSNAVLLMDPGTAFLWACLALLPILLLGVFPQLRRRPNAQASNHHHEQDAANSAAASTINKAGSAQSCPELLPHRSLGSWPSGAPETSLSRVDDGFAISTLTTLTASDLPIMCQSSGQQPQLEATDGADLLLGQHTGKQQQLVSSMVAGTADPQPWEGLTPVLYKHSADINSKTEPSSPASIKWACALDSVHGEECSPVTDSAITTYGSMGDSTTATSPHVPSTAQQSTCGLPLSCTTSTNLEPAGALQAEEGVGRRHTTISLPQPYPPSMPMTNLQVFSSMSAAHTMQHHLREHEVMNTSDASDMAAPSVRGWQRSGAVSQPLPALHPVRRAAARLDRTCPMLQAVLQAVQGLAEGVTHYKSPIKRERVSIKVPELEPCDLGEDVITQLSNALSVHGFAISATCVRKGCIELVLEVVGQGHPARPRSPPSSVPNVREGAGAAAAGGGPEELMSAVPVHKLVECLVGDSYWGGAGAGSHGAPGRQQAARSVAASVQVQFGTQAVVTVRKEVPSAGPATGVSELLRKAQAAQLQQQLSGQWQQVVHRLWESDLPLLTRVTPSVVALPDVKALPQPAVVTAPGVVYRPASCTGSITGAAPGGQVVRVQLHGQRLLQAGAQVSARLGGLPVPVTVVSHVSGAAAAPAGLSPSSTPSPLSWEDGSSRAASGGEVEEVVELEVDVGPVLTATSPHQQHEGVLAALLSVEVRAGGGAHPSTTVFPVPEVGTDEEEGGEGELSGTSVGDDEGRGVGAASHPLPQAAPRALLSRTAPVLVLLGGLRAQQLAHQLQAMLQLSASSGICSSFGLTTSGPESNAALPQGGPLSSASAGAAGEERYTSSAAASMWGRSLTGGLDPCSAHEQLMLDLGLFLEYTQSQRQKRATATANTAAANGDGSNTEGVHASEANNTSVCRRIAGPGSEEVEVSRAVAAQAASMATSPLYTALMDQLGVALLAHFVRNGSTSWASHVLSALVGVQGRSLAWVDAQLAASLAPAGSQEQQVEHHQGLLHLAVLSQRRAMLAQVLVWEQQYAGSTTTPDFRSWRVRWDVPLTPDGSTALHLVATSPKGPTLASWLVSGALEAAVAAGDTPPGAASSPTSATTPGPLTAHLRALWVALVLEDGVTTPDTQFLATHGRVLPNLPPAAPTSATVVSHHPSSTPSPAERQQQPTQPEPANMDANACVGSSNAASEAAHTAAPSSDSVTTQAAAPCAGSQVCGPASDDAAAGSKGWGARLTQALFPSFPPPEEEQYVWYLGESSRPYCMVWLVVALSSSSIIIVNNIKAGRWIEVPAALCWALPYWVTAWHMLRAPDQYLRYRERFWAAAALLRVGIKAGMLLGLPRSPQVMDLISTGMDVVNESILPGAAEQMRLSVGIAVYVTDAALALIFYLTIGPYVSHGRTWAMVVGAVGHAGSRLLAIPISWAMERRSRSAFRAAMQRKQAAAAAKAAAVSTDALGSGYSPSHSTAKHKAE